MPLEPGSIVEDRAFGGMLLNSDFEICLVRPVGRGVWALPKGHLDPGETPLQAAEREVREETGFDAEIGEFLGEISYTFPKPGPTPAVTVAKIVQFWAMFRSSDLARGHDHEMEDLRWVPLDQASSWLSYPTERGLFEAKLERLRELAQERWPSEVPE